MKTVTRVIAGIFGGIVVLLGIISFVWTFVLGGSSLGSTLGTGVANTLLDISGVKEHIDETLRDNADTIANATGLSADQVTAAIDQLDITSWSATTLPDDAVATGSFETTYRGVDATVTTYADSSYVTVNALGQDITLAVPESAQAYVSLLSYL